MADGIASGEVEPERLIGERIAGRFVIERLIGRGELSTAFRATDERLHRRVTVKVFHPRHRDDVQVVESQLAAARAVARLSHEHVAMVIDRGEHEGMPLVVLEHVRGENLQERIERYAPLAVGEVATYALQCARALAYAHGHGVVHGNLRPGNVLLTEERDVKLVDFGGGSYVAQLVGNPYAAPELREVDPGIDPEASDDVYALGALCFAALTEQAPRPGIEPSDLQQLRPDVSPRFAASIARALSTDPADRHLSMRELAAELASVREAAIVGDPEAGRHDVDQPTRAWSVDDYDEATDGGPRVAVDPESMAVAGAADAARRAPRRTGRRRRAQRPRTPREARARILAWSMVVAPLVALVIFGLMIAGERGNEQVESGEQAQGGPVERVAITGATSFDPEGDDRTEHESETPNVWDDDPQTTWQTEGYATPDFNIGAKPGVGLVLELAREADVREVVVGTDLPGWIAEVRTAPTAAPTLDGWRVVSEPTDMEDGAVIEVDMDGAESRYVLLWITKLALDIDDPDRNRARIADVRVRATGPGGS